MKINTGANRECLAQSRCSLVSSPPRPLVGHIHQLAREFSHLKSLPQWPWPLGLLPFSCFKEKNLKPWKSVKGFSITIENYHIPISQYQDEPRSAAYSSLPGPGESQCPDRLTDQGGAAAPQNKSTSWAEPRRPVQPPCSRLLPICFIWPWPLNLGWPNLANKNAGYIFKLPTNNKYLFHVSMPQ